MEYIVPIEDMDMKPVYTDMQVVQVQNDEVGSLVLQEDQQLVFNDNQQVVYQTTAPAQYQQTQQATAPAHYIIGSDELAQRQQQQQQQNQQVVLQHATMAEQHRHQQQVHYQHQQQQQQQQHEAQQQQLHLEQQQQQYVQQQQQQQQPQPAIQHVQQTQQIYYTSEQVLQPNTIVQQLQQKKQQEQYQQHAQTAYQQQTAQLVQAGGQQQQHALLQSPPQQQQQIVYRMTTTQPQQRQISMLPNTHVIVQPSGQQVLIQTPQHQELIMRQATIPQQGINIHAYNANRVVYTTSSQQQHALLQQSPPHVQAQQQPQLQLQTTPLHTQTAHLVQTRVVQPQQGNVVYHQVQMQKTALPQQQQPEQQQVQVQHAQQTTQVVRAVIRSKSPRGGGVAGTRPPTLIATRPALAPVSGTVMRQVRPRAALHGVAGNLVRGVRPGAGIRTARPTGSQLVVQTGTDTQTMQVVAPAAGQHVQSKLTITNLGQSAATGQQRVYRTHMVAEGAGQLPQMPVMRQTIRYRVPAAISAAPAPVVSTSSSNSSSSSSSMGLDLEERIQAAIVKKEQQKPTAAAPNLPMQLGTGTTLTTTYYQSNNVSGGGSGGVAVGEEEQLALRTASGPSMTVAEFRKRNTLNASPSPTGLTAMRQVSGTGGAMVRAPVAVATAANKMAAVQPVAAGPRLMPAQQRQIQLAAQTAAPAASAPPQPQPQPQLSSVQQTSHNNYEIHSQQVLKNRAGLTIADRDRNSAKMLVILASGEQRLITFTLPRESCTVQDLLEQVSVPFDNSTTIQCGEHRGADVDFVVTVGFSVNESASELISRAEESLQINRAQENAAAANAAAAAAAAASAPTSTATAYTQATAAAEQAKREAANTARPAQAAAGEAAPPSEEPPSKIITGFYAVCHLCGFTGLDHAKCERCKRVFQEPPKRKSYMLKSANAGAPATATAGSGEPSAADKKRELAAAARFGKQINYAGAGRGRGSMPMRGGRARSNRRMPEAEPVVLLSSEDEADGGDDANPEGSNLPADNDTNNSNGDVDQLPAAFAFEPTMPEIDEEPLYKDFVRGDVTDQSDTSDSERFSTSLQCACMRIAPYRIEVTEPVTFTSKGVRIAGLMLGKDDKFVLHIYKHEVIKVIAHFATSEQAQPLITIYVLKKCAQYVKTALNMPDDVSQSNENIALKSQGSFQMRRLILLFDDIPMAARETIKSMFGSLDEISAPDAAEVLKRIAESERKTSERQLPPRQLRADEQLNLLMYPPKGTGGLCIRMEDYVCLTKESYLNDIIIDFYLLWLRNTLIPEAQRERTHIFSTFFYKRLTTLTRPTDMKQTAAQKRHARVQKWTKGVDIFDKDFIIVPINEQSHWFLAIICFPCLKGPVTYDTNQPVEPQQLKRTRGKKVAMQIGNTTITPLSKRDSSSGSVPPLPSEICRIGDDESERDEAEGDDSDMASEDSESSNPATACGVVAAPVKETPQPAPPPPPPPQARTNSDEVPAVKQPLILIFDSLAGASRSRVVATLRDYLTCEYKIKKPDAQAHVFNKDNMPGHCVKVPQQNNFTDCGLYLLQYVEQFFNDPIRDYRLPIKQLTNWFDLLTVTKKREDIALLIQQLMDENNAQRRLVLPVIEFPTLNGQIVEYPEETESAEFEEEEGHDDEEQQANDLHDENNAPTDMEVDATPEELQQAKAGTLRVSTSAVQSTSNANTAITTTTAAATANVLSKSSPRLVLKRRIGTAATGSPASNGATAAGNGELMLPQLVGPATPGAHVARLAAGIGGQGGLKIRKIEP